MTEDAGILWNIPLQQNQTDLLGLVWLQVLLFQPLHIQVFEGFSETRVDLVVHLRQLQEFGIDGWDELKEKEKMSESGRERLGVIGS